MAQTLADALRGYLQYLVVERGLAANTVESYRRDLLRYVSVLAGHGRTRLGDVTAADVAEFLASLREGDEEHAALAVSSAARAVIAVRGLHAFAVAQGLAELDPAREVPPPTPPRRLPKAITLTEVERLLAAAGPNPNTPNSPDASPGPAPTPGFAPTPGAAAGVDPRILRDRALLEFLYGTGARISEATGLDVDELQLDSEDPMVRLVGKGGKHRVVPVGSYAVRALEAYLVRARPALARASLRGTPAVFLNARGGRLTRQGAWGVLHAAAGRAGLTDVSPHTLRHSFATHMLDGGADIRVVQELLGHASVTTTQVYTLITVDRLREVYASSHPRALGLPLGPRSSPRAKLVGERAQGWPERSIEGCGGVPVTAGGSLVNDHDGPLQGGRVPDVTKPGHHGQRGTENDQGAGPFHQRIAGFGPRPWDILAEENNVRLEHAQARGTADDLEGLGRFGREHGVPVRVDHGRRLPVPSGIGGREPSVECGARRPLPA
jgi:integrase/recombinase XerD